MTDTPIERLKGLLQQFEDAVREAETDCHFGTVPRWRATCAERDQLREQILVIVDSLATIEPIPSAEEGERAKAFEEAARVVDTGVRPEEAAALIGAPGAQEPPHRYFRRAIAARIRALATLPSEPLRDD